MSDSRGNGRRISQSTSRSDSKISLSEREKSSSSSPRSLQSSHSRRARKRKIVGYRNDFDKDEEVIKIVFKNDYDESSATIVEEKEENKKLSNEDKKELFSYGRKENELLKAISVEEVYELNLAYIVDCFNTDSLFQAFQETNNLIEDCTKDTWEAALKNNTLNTIFRNGLENRYVNNATTLLGNNIVSYLGINKTELCKIGVIYFNANFQVKTRLTEKVVSESSNNLDEKYADMGIQDEIDKKVAIFAEKARNAFLHHLIFEKNKKINEALKSNLVLYKDEIDTRLKYRKAKTENSCLYSVYRFFKGGDTSSRIKRCALWKVEKYIEAMEKGVESTITFSDLELQTLVRRHSTLRKILDEYVREEAKCMYVKQSMHANQTLDVLANTGTWPTEAERKNNKDNIVVTVPVKSLLPPQVRKAYEEAHPAQFRSRPRP